MDLQLRGKSVLITGASRGIGLATARCFAAEGCSLHLVARKPDTLSAAVKQLRADTGADVQGLALDLREPSAVEQLDQLLGAQIDILVNNAGDMPHGDLQEIDAQRWRSAWDLKVYATIDLSRAMYARMRQKRSGVIINVIGISGGEMIVPSYIAGTAGNAALDAFTRALGACAPADGLRVVGVHPGLVATDRQITRWQARAEQSLGDASRWPELTTHLPFGRLAHPAEVAQTIVFLASGAASYISGTSVAVDGGMSQRHQAR